MVVKERPKQMSPWQSTEKHIKDFPLGQKDGETHLKDTAVG
jgi:hypothetical protein